MSSRRPQGPITTDVRIERRRLTPALNRDVNVYGSRRSPGRRDIGVHVYAHTAAALDLPFALPLLDPENMARTKVLRAPGANKTMGPLEGVKVIDMTTVLMGPYATQMLGDYGADVIKIETPDGHVTRLIGPTRHPGMGPVFLNTNRSKRSLCLDLKKPGGSDAVLRLIASADVLVYNVRPQAMARLQLGHDVVSKLNPRLVYAGVFGFGQDGPYAAKPAYDDLIQGATALPALMAQTGGGVARYVPNALVDRIVGLTAVGAICASLVHRDRTGRGQRVDIPMFETMAGFVMGDHMGGLTYEPPLDKGGY